MTSDSKYINNVLYLRLCKNFNLLEKKNWIEFYKKCEADIDVEKEDARIAEVMRMELPSGWSNSFLNDARAGGVFAQNAEDGLALSLNNLGKVDVEYISQITGLSIKDVIAELSGSVYQNPDKWDERFYKGWETSEEYLSGEVFEMLKSAKKANEKYKGYFNDNVAALEKVLPQKISAEDIYVTPGSPWVPEDIIDDFIQYLLGYCDTSNRKTQFHTEHNSSISLSSKSAK